MQLPHAMAASIYSSIRRIISRLQLLVLPDFVCLHPSTPVWNGHDFSICFQDLMFGCIPNVVTVILIAFYVKIYPSSERQKRKMHLEFCGLKKSLGIELLVALAIFFTAVQIFQLFLFSYESFGFSVHNWCYVSTQIFAWVLSCWVLHHQYEAVMVSCKALQYWWFLRSLLYIPTLHSLLKSSKVPWSPEILEDSLIFITSATFALLVLFNARKVVPLANSHYIIYMELQNVLEPLLDDKVDAHPEGNSVWQFLVFDWVTPLMDIGTTRQLSYDDLFELPMDLDPKFCSEELSQTWKKEQQCSGKNSSLFRAIYLVYGWQYLGIGILKMCNDTLGFVGPLLLNVIVHSIDDGSKERLHFGYWCALLMGIVSASRAFLGTQYTFLVSKLKLRVRASIITLIYQKALSLSISERSSFSNGEIQTFMSVDAERTVNFCGSLHEFWSLPLQMTAAMSLLYMQVKFAFLAGLIVIVLLIPVNKIIASRISKASFLMMQAKDERVRKIGEIIMNIRTIKMYGWETLLSDRVMEIRKEEVHFLGVRKYLDACCVYFWATTPIVFSFFTFGIYYLLGHELEAATVFTSLALFNMLISPLNSFPWVINGLIEASISIKRLRNFLACPEVKPGYMIDGTIDQNCNEVESTEEENNDGYAIVVHNADFSWTHSQKENPTPVLRNISLSISKGCTTLVLGKVGAGKSSLFQAILGEMHCFQGTMMSQGPFGYVSQDPWIQSGTIRENILFGSTFKRERYEDVLHASALDVDIERMSGKDLCEVGEHGFNLSGGQRARLALARALYQDCDIFLLDDPLSAVDAHVASWLLEHAIKGPLMHNKTIILSTYNTQAISVADMVVILEAGCIKWAGSLLDCKKHFQQKGNSEFVNVKKELTNHYFESLHVKPEEDRNSVSQKQELQVASQEIPVPLVEEEARMQGAVQIVVYWVYASLIGWAWLAFILLSMTLMQVSRNGSDLWLSIWVDAVSSHKAYQHSTYFYLKVYVGIAMANSIFTCARAFSFAYGGLTAAFKVHKCLMEHVIAAPIHFFDHNPIGRILNRFSSDQYAVDDSLPFIANILLANAFSLLGIVIIFCMMQWTFLIIFLPLSLIYASLQKYYRSTSRELRRLDSTSRSPIYSSFTEVLDGASTIRAFGYESNFITKNLNHVTLNQRAAYSEIAASLWLSIRLQLLAACIIFFISMMAFVGHGHGQQHSVTVGLAGLALSYATPVISLLSDLLATFTETEKEMVSVERIHEYVELQEDTDFAQAEVKVGWPTQGSIHFDQVTLLYKPSPLPALKMVSFFIQGGSQVGVAGRTGAGKSSILNVLFRLAHPTEGHVYIDGIDIQHVPVSQLRSNLSIVPQRPFLFQGSLRDNLDPQQTFTDLQIWEMLDKCHLKETVRSSGGLSMQVKEAGESFSLGQCQLVCVARSLLRSTQVLFLDECTANVDLETAKIVQKTIAYECHGVTVVTIAHRMASIMDLDHVLILDHGELVEEGKPRNLMGDPASKFSSFVKACHL